MADNFNSLQHILIYLKRIDVLVRTHAWHLYSTRKQDDGNLLPNVYLSEQEVESLLKQIPVMVEANITLMSHEQKQIVQQTLNEIALEISQYQADKVGLRLLMLAKNFKLSEFEINILLLALAPELDVTYQKLYGYLQNDLSKIYPSINLILNLLCCTFKQDVTVKTQHRMHFMHEAPLLHNKLIQVSFEKSASMPLLNQLIQVAPRVMNYLLCNDEVSDELKLYVAKIPPSDSAELLIIAEKLKTQLLTKIKQTEDQCVIIYLYGSYRKDLQILANDLSHSSGMNLLKVTVQTLIACTVPVFQEKIILIVREALLQNAALLWQDFTLLLTAEQQEKLDYLLIILQSKTILNFFAGATRWQPIDELPNSIFIYLPIPQLDFQARQNVWQHYLEKYTNVAEDVNAAEFANKFAFQHAQIRDVWCTAQQLNSWRNEEKKLEITRENLHQACALHTNQNLGKLAQKIIPHYNWHDIILPQHSQLLLKQILNHVKYRAQIYETWGFAHKLALGKGLHILFTGSPGTGKTMAADVLANELQLDLYKIDLSNIVSKYIGETEKNLSQIFAEAETSNAILFFDEADALFGKRGEVNDARDRYANIEVSYLLQKLDEYPGIVILASNLRKNIDDAFVRRLHFCIDFPFPDVAERRCIWQKVWPASTPLSKELDFELLAQRFEISGGNIRNIALTAAFLAAAEAGQMNAQVTVSMQHLLQATHFEYQKMGRLVTADTFQI